MHISFNNILRKILSRRSSTSIIFPHVPKCAGNSIIDSIRSANSSGYIQLTFDSIDPKLCSLISDGTVDNYLGVASNVFAYKCLLSKANLIIGHAPLVPEIRQLIPQEKKVITLLRDPVNRWISNYIYDRYKDRGVGKHSIELETYLTSSRGKISGQYYGYFFGSRSAQSEQEIIDSAVENLLGFDLVGLTSDMDNFIRKLEAFLEIKLVTKKSNTSPRRDLADSIKQDPELMRNVNEICSIDKEIYNRVKSQLA